MTYEKPSDRYLSHLAYEGIRGSTLYCAKLSEFDDLGPDVDRAIEIAHPIQDFYWAACQVAPSLDHHRMSLSLIKGLGWPPVSS